MEWFVSNINEIVGILFLTTAIGSMILWSHKKLHQDIVEIRMDMKTANGRIDALYGIIIDIMKEKRRND